MVSFSSDENDSCATEMSKADRWETLDHRWNLIRRSGAYPETRAEDVAEQTIQFVEKVPDTIDSIKEKLLGALKALKPLTRRVAVAVAEFAFASPREPPDKMSPGQDALENTRECPSDPDTRVQEIEAKPRRVSKYGIVAVTSRYATLWNTRTQWSSFGFICGLAQTDSASDEVMVSGYWSKRGNGTTTGVVEVADSIPLIRGECWGRRSSRTNDAGLACGQEQLQRVESPDAAQR